MIILFILLLVSGASAFSCKDQDGKDVDWFAVYKMPIESADNSIPGVNNGTGWYYVDVNQKGALKASFQTLDSNQQAIAYTLQQFYDKQNDPTIFHAMYNDEPYNLTTSMSGQAFLKMLQENKVVSHADSIQFGHTKGTIFFDGTTGVWLVHSVPKFPPPDHYEYPLSGHNYGQTMLCMTFQYSELSKIGTQLYFNHPDIYSSSLPTTMAKDNPDLANVIGGGFKQGGPFFNIVDLRTAGGYTFTSFAKTNEFNNDLYDALVAPNLKADISVETWRRGSVVPLECSLQYHATDVQDIGVGNTGQFKYTKDHSKWARSLDTSKPYICIGDINRMTTQYVRGGGTECISSSFLWNAFNVVVDTNQC